MSARLTADEGRARGDIHTPLGLALAFVATACTLVSPLAGYVVSLLAVYVSARGPRSLSWLAIVAFASAGAMTFASRNFIEGAVDFEAYYAVFFAICTRAPAEEGVWAFGPELGLPLVYEGLAALGVCGLSLPGLAYVQGLMVAAPMLLVIERGLRGTVPKQFVPEAVAGAALLFSFFFVTQLSRQALSSVFVLYALVLAHGRPRLLAALLVATLCHLTAPLIFALAWTLRRWGRIAIVVSVAVAAAAVASLEQLLGAIGTDLSALFGKLEYYSVGERSTGAPSDIFTVVMLSVAGLAIWLGRRRLPDLRRDVPMLLGFALVSAVMLPLPLAATRFALPLGSLAIGAYLFAGTAALSLAAARLGLVLLVAVRVLSFSTSDSEAAHSLWRNHAPWTAPGGFLSTYLR